MTGSGIQQDSIRRCDLYSNPYDARLQANPALVRARAQFYEKSHDTLTTSQSRMENEILQKLQDKNFFGSDGKLLFLAKVGRYLFLFITVPPFLFCYGIPKWLFMEALPKVFHFTVKTFQRVTEKIRDIAEKYVSRVAEFGSRITSPILAFIKTGIEKTRELFHYIRGKVQDFVLTPFRIINQKVFQPVREFYGQLKNVGRNIRDKLSELKSAVRHFFIYLPTKIQDKGALLFEKAKELFKDIPNRLKKLFVPLVKWASPKLDAMKHMFDRAAKITSKLLELGVYSPVRNTREAIGKLKGAYVQPVTNWILSKHETLKKHWENVKREGLHLKEKVKEKAVEWINKITQQTKTVMLTAKQFVTSQIHEIAQLIPQPVLSFFTPIMTLFSSRSPVKRARTVLKAVIEKISDKVYSGFRHAETWLLKQKSKLRKLAKIVIETLYVIPIKFLSLISFIVHFFVTAIKSIFILFLLMLAWIRAIIRYTAILLRAVTQEYLFIR